MNLNNLFKKKDTSSKTIESLPKDYLLLQETVQDFIPLQEVRDSMLVLPNHEYKMVIEVKSINYYLKTAEEQETIEMQFRSALGSWDFPFAFYVQTRTIDADDIVKKLQDDVDKIPNGTLKRYGYDYAREMESLTKKRNGNLIKRNYMIVSCNDAERITTNQTEDDFAEYAFEKLSLDVKKVMEALAPIGLSCHVLGNEELIELFFVALNKHSLLKADEILGFTTDIVGGKEKWDVNKAQVLIDGLLTQLNNMLLRDHELTAAEISQAQALIKGIEDLKKQSEVIDENELFVL